MSLKLRFLLLILVLFAGLLGGLWLHDWMDRTDIDRLRQGLQQERETLVDRLVGLTSEPLRVFVADYAPWDDMMNFVAHPDPAWAVINIDSSLATHHVDAAWVLRPDGTEVHGATQPDKTLLRRFPLSADALHRLIGAGAASHFFVETPEGLLEVRGEAIRPSDPKAVIATPNGWLFAARHWDDAYLRQLGDLLGGEVLLTLSNKTAPAADEIVTHRPLPDWQGRIVRHLRTSFVAPALVRADSDMRVDLFILCAFGMSALLSFSVASHYWVIKPLRQLAASLAQRDTAPIADLLRRGGEFGRLSQLTAESFRHEEKLGQIYSAFNAIDDAVFIAESAGGRIQHVNLGAAHLLGCADDALVGRTLADFRAPPPDGSAEGLWLRRMDGRLIEVEAQEHALPGSATARLSVTVVRDISDRRHLEHQRLRAQRLESLGTLAGGVAHDMNNMLTPITMLLDELEDGGRQPSPDLLASVRSSVKRGAVILRQLLTFGRGLEGDRAPLAIGKLIEELGRIVDSTFPKSIRFQTDVARNLPAVLGDATQLHQVLLNLCVNARDALPDGGTLRVAAACTILDETNCALWSGGKPGTYVQLDVTDNGTGIAPEIIDRIFDPFFTTKPLDKGTGLGLSTTLGIIRAHGGSIQVRSKIGEGTTFSLLLPTVTAEMSVGAAAPAVQTFDGQGRTVLVVEDEEPIRLVLQRALDRLSLHALTASDGTEGLALFHQHKDEISLVITDLQMPGGDGLTLLRAIRAVSPTLPVLVMSGRIDETSLAALRSAGVSGLIDKPFGFPQVIAAVRSALG